MRDIVLRYIIVHLFINSCSLVMGNQAAQSEFQHHHRQQQQQQHQQTLVQLQPRERHANVAATGDGDGSATAPATGRQNAKWPADETMSGVADGAAMAAGDEANDQRPAPSSFIVPLSVTQSTADVAVSAAADSPASSDDSDAAAAAAAVATDRLLDRLPPSSSSSTSTSNTSNISSSSVDTNTATDAAFPWPTSSSQIRGTSAGPPLAAASNATTLPLKPTTANHIDAVAATHRVSGGLPTEATLTAAAQHEHEHEHAHHHKSAALSATPAQKSRLPKVQRTDAPILNHIFDTASAAGKHHHYHDHRYGPHFEDIYSDGNVTNITVQVGSTVYLNCRISLLQDKTVSWVRRKSGDANLDLLTVGKHTYSGDPRYKIEFQYPDNWRLRLEAAVKDDEGTYECQISTHPPRIIQKNVFVNDPKVLIIDETGVPLQDKYYEVDSTMQLSCIVRHVAMKSSVVLWSHGDQVLNYDTNRGGVSVKTEIMEKGANSTLFIAKINKSDSGNYTCSINSSHDFTVLVHVLNGESFAELHHGGSQSGRLIGSQTAILLAVLVAVHWTTAVLAALAAVRACIRATPELGRRRWGAAAGDDALAAAAAATTTRTTTTAAALSIR